MHITPHYPCTMAMSSPPRSFNWESCCYLKSPPQHTFCPFSPPFAHLPAKCYQQNITTQCAQTYGALYWPVRRKKFWPHEEDQAFGFNILPHPAQRHYQLKPPPLPYHDTYPITPPHAHRHPTPHGYHNDENSFFEVCTNTLGLLVPCSS